MENNSLLKLSAIALVLLILPMISLAAVTDVSLVTPADNYNTTDTTPTFTFNATSDTQATLNCTLYLNSTSYGINASVTNATDTNITASEISTDGKYEWLMSCTDDVDTVNSSAINITIDTTAPTTTLVAVDDNNDTYTTGAGTNSTYVNITLTCSDASTACDTILYCNDTANTCTPSATYSAVFNVSAEATTYVRYLSNDTLNNTETVNSFTVLIDQTYPSVSYVSAPTAGDCYENVVINISYTETNLDTCKLVWNSVEETFTSSDASNYWETKYLQQGTSYTFYTFCNDTAGQTNTTTSLSIYGKQTSSGGGGSSGAVPTYSAETVPVTMTVSPAVVDLKIYDENQKEIYTGAFRSGDTISIESGTYNFVMEAEGYQRKSVYMDISGAETFNYALSTVGLHQTSGEGGLPLIPILVILMILGVGYYLYKNR